MSASANPSTSGSYSPELFNNYTIAFVGNALECIFYGIYVVLTVTNLLLLHKKREHFLFFFTFSELINTTIYVAISLSLAPPEALSLLGLLGLDAISPWPEVMVDIAFVLNTWFTDAFLLYRCHVIWRGNKHAVGVPALIYLATIGASIAYLWSSANPGTVYTTASINAFGRPYWICSIALSVVTTCLLSVRLWLNRRLEEDSRQGQPHVGYVALMIIESAGLYAAFGVVALVLVFLNSPLVKIFFPILSMIQVIAPGLIVNRIARGMSLTINRSMGTETSARSRQRSDVETRQRDQERSTASGSATVHSSSVTNSQTEPRGTNNAMSSVHVVKSNV